MSLRTAWGQASTLGLLAEISAAVGVDRHIREALLARGGAAVQTQVNTHVFPAGRN